MDQIEADVTSSIVLNPSIWVFINVREPTQSTGKLAMSQQKKFLHKLFDFSFSEFISIEIAGVMYILSLVFVGLATLGIIIGGFTQSGLIGLGALIVAPLFFILNSILVRVGFEGFVASIRTADNTQKIVDYLRRRKP